MFDFLKPKFTDADLTNLLDVDTIKKQLHNAGLTLENIIENYWVLGYIYGYLVSQTYYYHIDNTKQSKLAISLAFIRLFRNKNTAYAVEAAFYDSFDNTLDNKDFIRGAEGAKNDRASLLLHKTNPDSLYKYLRENNIKPIYDGSIGIQQQILIQLVMAGINVKLVLKDNWALGYIFGMIDLAIQFRGITDQTTFFCMMTGAIEDFFKDKNMTKQAIKLYFDFTENENKDFVGGMKAGRNEYASFINDKEDPFGLAVYFFNEK